MINITSNVADEFDALEREIKRTLAKNVSQMKTDIVKNTPVGTPENWVTKAPKGYVGGTLRKNWDLDKIDSYNYTLSNNMKYADDIFKGRRQVPTKHGMKWVGSTTTMKDGITPYLVKWDDKIIKDMKELKR